MGHDSRQHPTQPAPRPDPKFRVVGAGLSLLIGLVIVLYALWNRYTPSSQPTAATAAAPPIGGIRCESIMPQYHIHSSLRIYDHGTSVVVPAQIGIHAGSGCMYWLHTHDATGLIHNEAPGKNALTLANFFHIWGKNLAAGGVTGHAVTGGEHMTVFVNHRLFTGDPRTISLQNHTDIVIDIGPPYRNPTRFNYPPM